VTDETTLRVPKEVMVSPATMPALAAGDPGTTATMCAPAALADDAGATETSTPRKPFGDDPLVVDPRGPGLGTVG
jgi:hypothetical protein